MKLISFYKTTISFILIMFLFFNISLQGQELNKRAFNWRFGENAGIDFGEDGSVLGVEYKGRY